MSSLILLNYLVAPRAIQLGILITHEFIGDDLLTPPMHASELTSILFNFYSNSQKAIKNACSSGRIHIRAGVDGKKVFFEFADNGTGIPPQYHDRVFDAFFTTSTSTSLEGNDNEDIQGTGLGLKIVRDIVAGHRGEVYIIQPPASFSEVGRFSRTLFNLEF